MPKPWSWLSFVVRLFCCIHLLCLADNVIGKKAETKYFKNFCETKQNIIEYICEKECKYGAYVENAKNK